MSDLLALAADWYWELDADLRFKQIRALNNSTRHCCHFTEEGLLGKHFWEAGSEETAEDPDALRSRFNLHHSFHDLTLHRMIEGESCYLELSGEPLFDNTKQFMGFRGVCRDTTIFRREYEGLKRFREAMDMCGDAIYLTDFSTMQFLDVNATVTERMGYSRNELLKMGPADLLMVDPALLKASFNEVVDAGADGMRSESTALSKSGRQSVSELHRRAMKVGNRWIIVSIARDMTARKKAEQALVRLGRMYAALSATEEAILRTKSPEELYQRVCNAAVDGGKFLTTAVLLKERNVSKLKLAAGSGRGLQTLEHTDISTDESLPSGRGLVGTACRTGTSSVSNDYCKDPATVPWHVLAREIGIAAAAAVPIRRGHETIGALLFYSDERFAFDEEIVKLLERIAESMVYALDNFDLEAEKIRNQERIQYLATHDSLTGLPNRQMFHELLRLAVESGKRYNRKFAVLFIDLDRFKFINDKLGHEAGDMLLQEVSNRFRDCLRASDVVARIGGDEFVVLINEITSVKQIASTARKLLSAAIKPVVIRGQECRVTASIGVALYPEHASDGASLMKNADMAMYCAKEEGKNNFQLYSQDLKMHTLERVALETQMRSALSRNEFALHYQPKIDFCSGQITGVEALLRWNSPELGYVSPMRLLPIAEDTGLIIPIGRWILSTACEQNVAWQQEGLPSIVVSINLSAKQFEDRDLLKDIATVLESTDMNPELLELELTESMVLKNVDHTVLLLKAIKGMGVRLAIDDFGTGYASLAQIRRFPIDTLKIDRSFIREIAHDTEDRAITDAIIALGKTMSLKVVAEGVETAEQERYLRDRACDEMQGYHFSRPITAAEFGMLLRANGKA